MKVGVFFLFVLVAVSCAERKQSETDGSTDKSDIQFKRGIFGYDKVFLQENYKNTLVLESEDKQTMVVLSPELQGRVMTSTLSGDKGESFGWLNYDLISSKKIKKQINPTGGEERFWLGPEGGQFSFYFKPNSSFDFKNWQVPLAIDTEPFNLVEHNKTSAVFQKEIHLTNHSGTRFQMLVNRKVNLLSKDAIAKAFNLTSNDYQAVAYETENTVKNIGDFAWKKETGLVSIWLLSMFNPSPETIVVVPVISGDTNLLGAVVKDDYFGKVPSDRLKTTNKTIFFKADGKSRGKIGISVKRATKFMGSYDVKNEVLTILEIALPNVSDEYVNAAWEVQKHPYKGDVFNSYNDGPLEDGSQMGPFYELESSSPALALAPDKSYNHVQKIYHFKGAKEVINAISIKTLNVSLEEIQHAFH